MKKKLKIDSIITLLVGVWVLFLPVTVGKIPNFTFPHTYLYNFIFVGLAVIVLSIISMTRMVSWAERVNVAAGIWLMVSPLFLIYYNRSDVLFWNSLICGILIATSSAIALPIVEKVIYHKHKHKEEEDFFLGNPHRH
ncbi:MAG: SPW repeat protein [Bacteriovorax sp.]